jgi:hypothetical protein
MDGSNSSHCPGQLEEFQGNLPVFFWAMDVMGSWAQRTKDLNSMVNLRTNSEDRFMVSLSAGDHSRLETCPGHGGFKRFI